MPAADGAMQLATGVDRLNLAVLPHTMAGRAVGATIISATHLIDTTSADSALCVIASPGNTSALQSAAAGTTNVASTNVVIRQIA